MFSNIKVNDIKGFKHYLEDNYSRVEKDLRNQMTALLLHSMNWLYQYITDKRIGREVQNGRVI